MVPALMAASTAQGPLLECHLLPGCCYKLSGSSSVFHFTSLATQCTGFEGQQAPRRPATDPRCGALAAPPRQPRPGGSRAARCQATSSGKRGAGFGPKTEKGGGAKKGGAADAPRRGEAAAPSPGSGQAGGAAGGRRPEGPEGLRGAQVAPPEGSGGAALLEEKAFEERLTALRSAAQEKVKEQQAAKVKKAWGPLDYDAEEAAAPGGAAPSGLLNSTAVKVGGGLVAVLALAFTLGDVFPNIAPVKQAAEDGAALPEEFRKKLRGQADENEAILKRTPADPAALEGAAVSYAELGEYPKAADYLGKLLKARPGDEEALRLLAEVRAAMKEFGASADAYRRAMRAAAGEKLGLLQGLADALIADGKPNEAVGEVLAARARLKAAETQGAGTPPPAADAAAAGGEGGGIIDPVQVELLLAKAYTAWKKPGDAVAVYDSLIASHQEDFRPFLAKGVLLNEQGDKGGAQRMFIQARYLARTPEAKALVDRLSGRATPPK